MNKNPNLPAIKYEYCKMFFYTLREILEKYNNYQYRSNRCGMKRKRDSYLYPEGTGDEITYYSKPLYSFRCANYWNWYAPMKKCDNKWVIQCFTDDMPRTKHRVNGGASEPVWGTAVCVMGPDEEYHVVYGEVFDRETKKWHWLETDPADIAEMVCA